MSWDYTPGESTRDWVRFMIGDTDSTNELLQNEEIDAALANEGSQYAAAAVSAEALAGKFADQSDRKIGPLSISTGKKAERYERLAKRLRANIGRKVAAYAGGISEADVESVRDDADRYGGSFREGMHDLPGTGTAQLAGEEENA